MKSEIRDVYIRIRRKTLQIFMNVHNFCENYPIAGGVKELLKLEIY